MYKPHPSPKLQDLFKAKPYQGAPPEDAEFVFVGLDANYAADIERKEDVFKLVEEYHEDGVRFWRDRGHHHPFLVDGYRGSGRRYHETFAKIGLVRNDASRVSFIELLHVPTVGISELERADFDADHLDRINRLITSEQPRHIFVSSKVVALMRRSKRFDWLRGKRPNFEELPELYQEGSTTVYQIYHFSTWGDVAESMRVQARAILRLARAIDDTELSPAEGARVARLSQAELAHIDAALLAQVSDDWRKVARVVGLAMLSMPDRPSGVPDVFFAKRVGLLVESGRLESQGDLRRMRFSEVRRRSA